MVFRNMNKFDENENCPKCGGEFISTNYEKDIDAIHRKCERCKYGWNEKPLDDDEE
jgi:hypothetical protein